MRRHDREISSREEIDTVISAAQVCRIAMAKDDEPYLVPVSFGYDGDSIFIHTAKTGRKLDFFEANTRVCFEFEANVSIRKDDDDACAWTFAFESVIGYGTITELLSTTDKSAGLNQIMRHYSGRDWTFDEKQTATTRVWRIEVESLTGKRSQEKPGSSG